MAAQALNMGTSRTWLSLFLLLLLLLGIVLIGCKGQTELERLHSDDLKNNPKGVQLAITTEDGKFDYAAQDVVKFKLNYTSSEVTTYKAELYTDWNAAGVHDTAVVQYPNQQVRTLGPKNNFACCFSSLQYLNVSPVSTYSSFMLGRVEPGEYKLYLKTRRVFAGNPPPETLREETKPITVTSNMLTIRFH
jgi:hypothetical protein